MLTSHESCLGEDWLGGSVVTGSWSFTCWDIAEKRGLRWKRDCVTRYEFLLYSIHHLEIEILKPRR